jgi:hypothetical protein
MNEIWGGVITIATALVGVAILAVLVQSPNTSSVIQAATQGFASDLSAAENINSGGGNILGGGVLSGGAGGINVY